MTFGWCFCLSDILFQTCSNYNYIDTLVKFEVIYILSNKLNNVDFNGNNPLTALIKINQANLPKLWHSLEQNSACSQSLACAFC